MSTVTYRVDGMSCGHCASSVKQEVGSIPGVVSVDVDVATGKVAVDTSREVRVDAIERAIADAGYRLARRLIRMNTMPKMRCKSVSPRLPILPHTLRRGWTCLVLVDSNRDLDNPRVGSLARASDGWWTELALMCKRPRGGRMAQGARVDGHSHCLAKAGGLR